MLQLIDLYWVDEQVFGLIRTATKFSRSQPEHPRRAEVMLKLMDGYAATARHEDVITTGRQFLDLFPKHTLTNPARDRFATALECTGRGTQAATLRGEIWKNGGSTEQGIRAIRLSVTANKGTSFKEATALATAMAAKLPADVTLTSVGFEGMAAAERAEQWSEGLQLAKTLLRRKAPSTSTAKLNSGTAPAASSPARSTRKRHRLFPQSPHSRPRRRPSLPRPVHAQRRQAPRRDRSRSPPLPRRFSKP